MLLDGITALDFSQFLAGPSCALRLADLGARVIKIERPGLGDNSRKLVLNEQMIGKDSLLFHTINRGKESIALNLKDTNDKEITLALIKQADILIENNRPGIMKKLGLDYESVKKINPRIIYATVTGYGPAESLKTKPGQDLLAQSMSGITFLNGNANQPPTPMALSIADTFAGIHMAEGILAALIRRNSSNEGALIEVSLLESAISLQFEVLTSYFNDGNKLPQRSAFNNAHAYLAAPYGIYKTKNSYISLAMGSLEKLGTLIDLPQLATYDSSDAPFRKRDEIKEVISSKLLEKDTSEWLAILQNGHYWCAPVFDWDGLRQEAGYEALDIEIDLHTTDRDFKTLGCPIKVNGKRPQTNKPGPKLDQNRQIILKDFTIGGVEND